MKIAQKNNESKKLKLNKDYKKEFIKCLESISYGTNSYNIFQDFLTLSTCSFQNLLVKNERIEKQYLDIIAKYKNPSKFSELLAITTMALDEKFQDFLGEIFMNLGFGSVRNGQFFTPHHVSECIARIVLNKNIFEQIEEKGFYTLHEPACGSGGMIIALAQVTLEKGYNPQKVIRFQGIDIDLKSCQMAYIQTSLFGLNGEILHGDSLSLEFWNKFITPWKFYRLA